VTPADEARHTREIGRIRSEYARRRREVSDEDWRVRLFFRQGRERALLSALWREGALPLADRRVLDVGCGSGQTLVDFETWGAKRGHLAGIELDPERARAARERLSAADDGPSAELREGDAAELPWPDGTFDVVFQATTLSSILDVALRRRVASEMARVLAPGGSIVSYDMRVNNPRNPNVRGLGRRELMRLFEGFALRARPITLLAPLSRRLVPVSWRVAAALERARVLNTHLLAVLRRD
jgi:SAM-dependent methyltransferase